MCVYVLHNFVLHAPLSLAAAAGEYNVQEQNRRRTNFILAFGVYKFSAFCMVRTVVCFLFCFILLSGSLFLCVIFYFPVVVLYIHSSSFALSVSLSCCVDLHSSPYPIIHIAQ